MFKWINFNENHLLVSLHLITNNWTWRSIKESLLKFYKHNDSVLYVEKWLISNQVWKDTLSLKSVRFCRFFFLIASTIFFFIYSPSSCPNKQMMHKGGYENARPHSFHFKCHFPFRPVTVKLVSLHICKTWCTIIQSLN